MNQRDRDFFSVSDATITSLDGSAAPRTERFLLIGRSHVRLIAPQG